MEQYNLAIIGGGMGGVAAALTACDAGLRVVLTEPTDWLGGQMTSQGTSAFDEHAYIETFGGTASYYRLREAIRDHYRRHYGIQCMPDGTPLNPGNGWVSGLCFEPAVGVQALNSMLAAYLASGQLTILYGYRPVAAHIASDSIISVTVAPSAPLEIAGQPTIGSTRTDAASSDPTTNARVLQAPFFLDATELGDLLPLAGVEHVTGAESADDTGEPFALTGPPRPSEVQSFTFPFVVEFCPGETHTIPEPDGYQALRDRQPYSLTLTQRNGPPRPFRVFEHGPTGLPPFWTYRRIRDGMLLDPTGQLRDLAMINWASNDYHFGDILGASEAERIAMLDEARRLSLGFLYWLQTECPRDDGSGCGYPEMRLVPEALGTGDGLSKAPYIRESRRIIARRRIVAHEILAEQQPLARAAAMPDSVGIGWYHMDLHPANGNPIDRFEPTRPFQIPLGALIPVRVRNLLAANKNIGSTHLSNGAYRLHPVEWAIGEAAGALVVFCMRHQQVPASVHSNSVLLHAFQASLLARGIPLAWAIDIPLEHPLFTITQQLLLAGAIAPDSSRSQSMLIEPDQPLSPSDIQALCQAAHALGYHIAHDHPGLTWSEACGMVLNHR